MKTRLRLRPLLLPVLAAILLAFPPAAAQWADDDNDDYEQSGIRQSVARVSYFEGAVSFNSGDDPDDWQPASINYPMTFGDRIWSGRNGRVELQLRGGTVYLGPETDLAALDLTYDVRQLSLTLGTATFRVRRLARDEVFEVATPNVSVTFQTPGTYRIDVDEEGNSRVSVFQGRAFAAAAGGQLELSRGDQIRVWGIDRPDYDIVGLSRTDSWDRWVERRARRYRSVHSASYVHPDIFGADDLDAYGSWQSHSEYGSVWFPRVTTSGWEPYRQGRWVWRDPWGWTWLSSEPWGWAPYHYGRWAVVRGRWCWIPVGPRSQYPGYSPAVVGFVGGGAGWSVSVSAGGFVGWFPLGPREPFEPWWYRSSRTRRDRDYSYAYRSRATVVGRDVFVRGGSVERAIVRDARTIREVAAAPVLRGPIPVLPTRESIRVSLSAVAGRTAAKPPQQLARREVVTRTAPPPAPPSFDKKLEVIRKEGGAPVSIDVSRRIAVEEHRGEKAAQPVRPAAREEVVLAPRGQMKTSRRPQALAPSGERRPATPDRPVPGREQVAPTRAPEPARVNEPERPANEPRPPRERAPKAQPESWREPSPTRPVLEAKPDRNEVSRPPERPIDRPERVATPRVERAPAPEPRGERAEPKKFEPKQAEPRQFEPKKAEPKPAEPRPFELKPTEPKRAEPRQLEPKQAEPKQGEPKQGEPKKLKPGKGEPEQPGATPTPKKGKKLRDGTDSENKVD